AAEAIQQGLARAGITVTIQPLDDNAYSSEVTAGDGSAYDLVLSSWQPDVPSPNANLTPLFDSSQIGSGNYNLARYDNPDVDAAILEASSTIDPDEAHAKWAAVDRQILEESPVVPLIYSKNSFIHGSAVENFVIGEFPAYPSSLTVTLAALVLLHVSTSFSSSSVCACISAAAPWSPGSTSPCGPAASLHWWANPAPASP